MRYTGIERTRPSKAANLAATAVALLLATLSPAAVTAQPRALTASEMDGVTAGGIRVDAIAFAQASGDFALAQTRSRALVGTINDRIEFGVGFAEGLAFACCSRRSEVTVSSNASSTGEIVHSTTSAFTFRGAIAHRNDEVSYFAYGYTAAFLVALSLGDRTDPGLPAVRERRDHLGGSIGRLIEVSQISTQDGIASGFELAPLFVVALRWRVLRDWLAATPAEAVASVANLRANPAPFAVVGSIASGLLR
jgi:hypothetical protein